jgi:hypothetical protein
MLQKVQAPIATEIIKELACESCNMNYLYHHMLNHNAELIEEFGFEPFKAPLDLAPWQGRA